MSTGKIVLIVIASLLIAGTLVAAGLVIKTVTTRDDKTGTVVHVDDPEVRAAQIRAFTTLYQRVQDADDNLQILAEQAAADPESDTPYTDLTNEQQICTQDVAAYNAMAATSWVQSAKDLPAGLPASIGNTADTDCQPDNPPTAGVDPSGSEQAVVR